MNKKGFTLVELLAVIAILAILVIIALPNVLKMFNDAKKNSFVTETKTVYSEISKKYISESMKGNKLTYVSSEDDTKLEMTGRDLQYCVFLNDDGTIKSMKVSNGEYIAELPSGKKITDLKSTDLKDVPTGYEFECVLEAVDFKTDSWAVIANNAKKCINDPETCPYKVGDEKEIEIKKYGRHKVRIANLSSPTEEGCGTEGFSESACGFIIEFSDVITSQVMNSNETNIKGWPASAMYGFLNDENDTNSIINLLPNELKKVIVNTKTVSGNGSKDTDIFTSNDKLYLLATKEIYGDDSLTFDMSKSRTRQLDYYINMKVTVENNLDKVVKNHDKTISFWWLRSAYNPDDQSFFIVDPSGYCNVDVANSEPYEGIAPAFKNGISPAFRIG